MWRWVTRGLVLSFVAALATAAAFGQTVCGNDANCIGSLDSPDPSIDQSGVVLVRGFALALPEITKIELFVDDQFQYRVNTGIPLIDVIQAYPNWPGIQNAAPGFQTGFLASRFSNGPHTVAVRIYTPDNHIYELGRRTININNANNQPPFGSVDIPDLKGIYDANGSFPVVGWAADADGIARVDVKVDDLNVQSAVYGDARPDVANAFPDFPDALFSGFVANIDTTRIQDGVHQLTVVATDRLGTSRTIGRRTVQVLNSLTSLKPFGYLDEPKRDSTLYGTLCGVIPIVSPPTNPQSHITPIRGWALDLSTRSDVGGVSYIEFLVDGRRWISTDDCAFSPIFSAYVNCRFLPRYDVARYYPTYPDSPRSGFMFALDVGALFALGVRPGGHNIKVRVGDLDGNTTDLPNRDGIPVVFTCAETTFVFPAVGFIDIPTTYDYVKGNVTFQGWAVDENGGVNEVEIFIDGNFIGKAQYGFPRPDVQVNNPFRVNSLNSGWRFIMDTTKISNSRHRLTVRVMDTGAHVSEIGSVDFYVDNPPPANP
jgi:Bacterial Ig domain